MQRSFYREWMRRLQDFLAAAPFRPPERRQPPPAAA
jgi:hypothetical protein